MSCSNCDKLRAKAAALNDAWEWKCGELEEDIRAEELYGAREKVRAEKAEAKLSEAIAEEQRLYALKLKSLQESVAGLRLRADQYERDREHNAALVVERDGQIAEMVRERDEALALAEASTLKELAAMAFERGQEAEKLKARMAEAERWVSDLQSGMYVNCVYCGHRYGPKDKVPASMAEVLKRHVEQCPKHPMSALKTENATLRRALESLKNWRTPAVLGEGDYHKGLLCGLEDRGLQGDAYEAMLWGYEQALERVGEEIDRQIDAALAPAAPAKPAEPIKCTCDETHYCGCDDRRH